MDAPFFAFNRPTSATFVIDRRIHRMIVLGWYHNEESEVTYLDVDGVTWDSEYLTEIDGYSIDRDVWR